MKIISPLTLLIVPLIGSLIILSYPYSSSPRAENLLKFSSSSPAFESPAVTTLAPLNMAAGSSKGGIAGKVITPALAFVDDYRRAAKELAHPFLSARKDIIEQVRTRPTYVGDNSTLKKIAIITSLVNF